MKKRWTVEADNDLREMYSDGYVISMMARKLHVTGSAIKNRIQTLGLKRNFYRRPFTAAEIKAVSARYADTPTRILAHELGRTICSVHRMAWKMGIKKSEAFIASGATGRMIPGSNIGATFRFLPGHTPANKGLRRPGYSLEHGQMAKTTFKKGQRSVNYLPIGTIRKDADGYLRRKISDGLGGFGNSKVWEFVHRRTWEDAHGKIPKGYRLWWKDGNHENCAIENLELLSAKEHMARTTIHNLPKKLKDTIMLAGRLKRRIRRIQRDKEQVERSEKSPVRDNRKAKR